MHLPHLHTSILVALAFLMSSCLAISQAPNGIGSGNSLEFNGVSDFINIGDSVANGVRTIEMWVKPDTNIFPNLADAKSFIVRDYATGNGQSINEFGLYFAPALWGTGGKIQFYRRVGSTNYRISSDNDTWHKNTWIHVAGTIDPVTGMKLYINGVLQQDTNSSTNPVGIMPAGNSNLISLGRWGAINTRYFDGELDEIRLWMDARSQKEIRENMCKKLSGNEQGLHAYWRMDESTGFTIFDASQNSWGGAITGTTKKVSSAPIGDESANLYNDSIPWTGWNNASLKLDAANGDTLEAHSLSNTQDPFGIHIYRVDTTPNTTNGINACHVDYYFGVFTADYPDTINDYDLTYHYNTSSGLISSANEIASTLYTRHNNAADPWGTLPATVDTLNDKIDKQGETYRGEYILAVSAIVPNQTICEGDPATCIVASPSGLTYLWPDSTTGDTFCTMVPGNYTVAVTHPGGCVENKAFQVQFSPGPSANLGPDTAVCPGDTICITVNNFGGTSYLWSNGNTTATSCLQQGTHSVVVTDSLGCERTDSINIDTRQMPVANFSLDSIECPVMVFSDNSTGAGPLSYMWDFGDGNTSTSKNPQHQYQTNGNYTVQLIVTGACGSDTSTLNLPINCISTDIDAGHLLQARIFPNPTTGNITIQFPVASFEEAMVHVYDRLGRDVLHYPVRITNEVDIDLSGLAAGAYSIQVREGKRNYIGRIIRE